RRGVVPTIAGRRILDRARRVLFESRGLVHDAHLLRDNQPGEVRFGAGSYPAAMLLPEVLATLINNYPDISVKVEVSDWATLQHKVIEEELDFAIVGKHTVPPDAPLETHLVSVEDAGWYVRTGHPLSNRTGLSIRELRSYPLVSVKMPYSTLARLKKRLGLTPGETLELGIECNDLYALREVVLQSDAILSTTSTLCRQEVAAGRLTRLNLRDNTPTVELAITQPTDRTLSPAACQTI